MRGFSATLALASCALASGAAAQDQAAATGPRLLAKGSRIELMVLREVDSNKAAPGDPVRFMVTSPVVLSDGSMLADKGVNAAGEVLEAKKAGMALQRGAIRVALRSLALGDAALPVAGELQRKGKGGKADDILKIGLAPMYALFSPGNAAKLKAGETVYAVTDADVCVGTAVPAIAIPCPTP